MKIDTDKLVNILELCENVGIVTGIKNGLDNHELECFSMGVQLCISTIKDLGFLLGEADEQD